MNYYEHHIGDYAEATGHLSFVEDAAYSRLIRKYYASEKPIPADLKAAQRLVGARTREEKAAVQSVLEEFFQSTPDGWRHPRCDREIARFQEKRSKAQRSANARWGVQQPQSGGNANAQTTDANASDESMRTHDERNALHTPHTRHQTPDTRPNTGDTRSGLPEAVEPDDGPPCVSKASAVVMALKAEGIGQCNSGHPRLMALLEAGAEVQNFVSAAAGAKGKSNPFAYVLGTVEGQMSEARKLAANGRTTVANGRNGHRSARAAVMAEAVPGLVANGHAPVADFIDTETRDVTPRHLD